MKSIFFAICVLFSLDAFGAAAFAQSVTVKSGQSAELGSVYWVTGCFSNLDDFEGVKIVSGPPGLTLELKKQSVRPARQGCSEPVPGAMVLVTASRDAQPAKGTLNYVVHYRTKTGAKEFSTHAREINIVP